MVEIDWDKKFITCDEDHKYWQKNNLNKNVLVDNQISTTTLIGKFTKYSFDLDKSFGIVAGILFKDSQGKINIFNEKKRVNDYINKTIEVGLQVHKFFEERKSTKLESVIKKIKDKYLFGSCLEYSEIPFIYEILNDRRLVEHNLVGTIDLILKQGRDLILIDFKISDENKKEDALNKHIARKRIYLQKQLNIYRESIQGENNSTGWNIKAMIGIVICGDTWKILNIPKQNINIKNLIISVEEMERQ